MMYLKSYIIMIKIIIIIIVLLGFCYFSQPNHFFTEKPDCISGVDNQFIGYLDTDYLENSYQERARELLREKTPGDYRYIFKTFIDEKLNTYMYVQFIGQTGCFTVKMLVDKWDKLGGMKRTDGVSWPSELYDLKWAIEDIDDGEELIYIDMHKIID